MNPFWGLTARVVFNRDIFGYEYFRYDITSSRDIFCRNIFVTKTIAKSCFHELPDPQSGLAERGTSLDHMTGSRRRKQYHTCSRAIGI